MSSQTRSWSEWARANRFPAILSSIVVLVISFLVYLQFTLVVGAELNTGSWELREFSFRRDPFTNTQLTGIYYTPFSRGGTWISASANAPSLPDSSIRAYLTAKNLEPSRWDLVRIDDGLESVGRASILVRLIDSGQFGTRKYWIDWSNDQPKKAAVLWPAAQRLVAENDYNELPDLFEFALYEKDDTAFMNAVSDYLKAIAANSKTQ
jgi:hypothetical protein